MAANTHKSDIEHWSRELRLGITYKEEYGDSKSWATYKEYYRGNFPSYNSTTNGILPLNVTFSNASMLVPNVYFRNPYVNITPRWKLSKNRQVMDIHAKVVEATDNWLLGEMGVKEAMKTGVLDCYFTNRAIWKIGYDSEFGFNPEDEVEGGVTESGRDKKGNLIEYNINIKPGMPWVIRVDPQDIILPFGVRSLDEAPWIAHRVIRPLRDVKNDPKYENVSEISGSHTPLLSKDPRADFYKKMSKHVDWVEIIEIRDRRKRQVFAMIVDGDKYIREPVDDVLQVEGIPYVDMTFNEDTDYYWGPSDCKIIEPQQLEINEARTQAMLHRRVALLKFLVEKNGMTPTEVDKMLSENVGPVAFTEGKPKDIVMSMQPHIPPDLIQWTEQIRADVREQIGFSRQDAGELPPGRRTAYEVGKAEKGKQLRIDVRRDAAGSALNKIVRKFNQIIFSRWDSERVVQVVGYDGAKYWVKFKNSDIVGEYNSRVDVESMTPSSKEGKKQEILQVIGVLGKNPRANIDYLMKILIREYDWMDAMAILPEAPEMKQGAMGFQQFQGTQQKMLNEPGYHQARVSNTQKNMGRV